MSFDKSKSHKNIVIGLKVNDKKLFVLKLVLQQESITINCSV